MRWGIVLVPALLAGASAAPAHLPDHDRRQIADLVQTYLQRRADKVTETPRREGFGVPVTEAMAARLRVDEAKLEARRARWAASGGYSYAQASTTLTRTTVAPDGSVIAHVRELTMLHHPRGATRTGFAITHALVFDRTTAGWALASATLPPGTGCKVPADTQFCGVGSER